MRRFLAGGKPDVTAFASVHSVPDSHSQGSDEAGWALDDLNDRFDLAYCLSFRAK